MPPRRRSVCCDAAGADAMMRALVAATSKREKRSASPAVKSTLQNCTKGRSEMDLNAARSCRGQRFHDEDNFTIAVALTSVPRGAPLRDMIR